MQAVKDAPSTEKRRAHQGLMRGAIATRTPLAGMLELTRACNLKCAHCYLPRGSGLQARREMSTTQIMNVLDELADAGNLFLVFTGGEPLLRPDFAEIYRAARLRGIVVVVFTNGTLLTHEHVELFKDLPPLWLEVSLYGASRQTYQALTGSADAYDKVIRCLDALKAAGVRFKLKTVLLTLNRHDMPAMEALAASYGVDFKVDSAVFPRLSGDMGPLAYRVDPAEAVALECTNVKRLGHMKQFLEGHGQQAGAQGERSNKLYTCGAGLTSFHIDAYGGLKPCVLLEDDSEDILTSGLATAWARLERIRHIEAPEGWQCNSCDMRAMCSGCPAFMKLEGTLGARPSEYACKLCASRVGAIESATI